jgi:small conductance mechanosensitive channel
MVFYLIMTCVLLAVLGMFGVNVTSFAAILGAAGFAVGLAFQGTLGNFAAGVLLLVFRPFKVGDVINAAGVTAKVAELDLFTTVLDTPDNRRIIVPNSSIAGGTIENVSYHNERRVDVPVGVDYSASVDATRNALANAAESLSAKMIAGDGRGYQVVLGGLGDSAVNWTVRFWCNADDYWGVMEDLTQAVKERLDDAGIGIPYPTMDINVTKPE